MDISISAVGVGPRTRWSRKPRSIYDSVATIINTIEDPAFRQRVANHFGTEFNRRSEAFDPAQWARRTGGRVAANSAR